MADKIIIDNRVGEPDLDFIPPHIRIGNLSPELRAIAKLGYDLDRRGMKRTLNAIAKDFNEKNNSNITEANIVLATGARAAASSAILRVLGNVRRREIGILPTVLLMQPGYNLYEKQFEGFGCKLDFVNIANAKSDEERLQLVRDNLTHETLFLPICSPNNPTGEIFSEEFLKGLLGLLDEFENLHIINDSIYDRILRDPAAKVPNVFALANETQRKRVYETNALSKAYSYPAIRAGWLIGDPSEIAEIQEYKDAQFGPLNNLAQLVVIAALEITPVKIADYAKQVNDIYTQRLQFVHNKLSQVTAFEGNIPPGAFYYWADFSKIPTMAAELEERGIFVSVGKKFGASGFIRINCGAKIEVLEVIADNMVEICAKHGLDVKLKVIQRPKFDQPKFASELGR